jgi:hypothetical protein
MDEAMPAPILPPMIVPSPSWGPNELHTKIQAQGMGRPAQGRRPQAPLLPNMEVPQPSWRS